LKPKKGVQLSGKITLPLSLNGKSITGFAPNAFENQDNLTHVFWQKGSALIKEINGSAFLNCANLVYFEMPITVTTVRSNAFAGCTKLLQGLD
jgi:hypothetical protein